MASGFQRVWTTGHSARSAGDVHRRRGCLRSPPSTRTSPPRQAPYARRVTSPASIDDYLASLAPDRREVVEQVRALVQRAMPEGYEEVLAFGMISWVVPLTRYPDTYNGQPLGYVSLAAQKRHFSLYLMGLYSSVERELAFRERWTAHGRRLDMGKACLRFRSLEDLDLDLVAEAVASTGVEATSSCTPRRGPAAR